MRLMLVLMAAAAFGAEVPRTMRLDYVHTGVKPAEEFALDAVSIEGAWPGPASKRVDSLNLGKYRFEVRDAASGTLLYSRGFASIYGEWETTDEARATRRAFHESVRFPVPAARARVSIQKRDERMAFQTLWTVDVDPADVLMDRSAPPREAKVWAVQKMGEPAKKVDLLLIGDGYTAAEMEKWHADAKRLTEELFKVSPFKEHRSDFNVWALDVAAEESGVSRPSTGQYRRSPVRAGYDAFGSERYVLTFDNRRLRELASAASYEFVEIVVNGRTYGGGGIHNLYATVANGNVWTPYVFVHEFGHHFAGLADEYYTSDVAYGSSAERPEPWEPNVSADPKKTKWADLVEPGTALPTAWKKDEFEAMQKATQGRRRQIRAERKPESEMEALFSEELRETLKLLGRGGKVGAYEGAMYESKGYYRAQPDCIMFTRSMEFCVACKRAIERVIKEYTE